MGARRPRRGGVERPPPSRELLSELGLRLRIGPSRGDDSSNTRRRGPPDADELRQGLSLGAGALGPSLGMTGVFTRWGAEHGSWNTEHAWDGRSMRVAGAAPSKGNEKAGILHALPARPRCDAGMALASLFRRIADPQSKGVVR